MGCATIHVAGVGYPGKVLQMRDTNSLWFVVRGAASLRGNFGSPAR